MIEIVFKTLWELWCLYYCHIGMVIFTLTLGYLVYRWFFASELRTREKQNGEKRKKNKEGGKNEELLCDNQVPKTSIKIPLSVNYHFTRRCNYTCGFCFFTAKTSYNLPLPEAKQGLKLLVEAGMKKVNFSGGEPFLIKKGHHLGEMVKYCKLELDLESVSIVSNGSLITEKWFEEYATYVDIIAISCDSFNEETNEKIGRHARGKNHVEITRRIRQWCQDYKVAFKINSVINRFNLDEDMTAAIEELNPVRWKVFQCLQIEGENCGTNALRDADPYAITEEEFRQFCQRHASVKCLVPETSDMMRSSYLILDEYMRFLADTIRGKLPSKSILDVGVSVALGNSGFDEKMFYKRGGKYVWSKGDMDLEW